MGRWEPDTPGRLQLAALELYSERGFEQTTVAEIAQRAGLTERTFFRHFADKREVLFRGGLELQDLIVRTLAATPASTPPIDAVARGLEAAGAALQERADFARIRQTVIIANPGLRERELIKLAAYGSAMAACLRDRGVAEPAASLAAEAGLAAFRVAFELWAGDPTQPDLPQVIRDALGDLKAVTAGG